MQARILNPGNDQRLRRILAAVPPFGDSGIRSAWSLYTALAVGVHPWPDANHRTAALSFDVAVRKGLGVSCALDAADAFAMSTETRRIRDAHGAYRVAELLDAEHPYRRAMARFEGRLVVRPVSPPKVA